MLPFDRRGNDLPGGCDSWKEAFARGLTRVVRADALDPARIRIEDCAENTIRMLSIDLDGLPLRTKGMTPLRFENSLSSSVWKIGTFHLAGDPLFIEGLPVRLCLDARHCEFAIRDDQDRNAWMVPVPGNSEMHGTLLVEIETEKLRVFATGILADLARSKGVTLQDFQMEIKATSRSGGLFLAVAKARKFGIVAAVEVLGAIEIEPDFHVRLHSLNAKGEGTLGVMAARLVSAELEKWNERRIRITPPGFETLQLSRITLGDSPDLTLKAEFHS